FLAICCCSPGKRCLSAQLKSRRISPQLEPLQLDSALFHPAVWVFEGCCPLGLALSPEEKGRAGLPSLEGEPQCHWHPVSVSPRRVEVSGSCVLELNHSGQGQIVIILLLAVSAF